MKTIAVIGAGPVGSYMASLLAKHQFKVLLFDQKPLKSIGKPVQCTGIFPQEILKFIKLDPSFHLNTTQYIQIISPLNHTVTLNKTEYIFDRTKFDQHLLNQALQNGAQFHPQHKLIKITKNKNNQRNLIFQNRNSLKIFSPDIIIAADGPLSLAYQYLNKRKKSFYYGLQATIKGNFQKDTYQTFFNQKITPHLFAWLVPESKTRARIGLAAKTNPSQNFQSLLKQLNIKSSQILQKQAGLIPIFNPQTTFHKNNIFLLGDAASHVKPTTLGGLTPSFQEAYHLTQSIINHQPYQPKLKSLKLHLKIRTILNRFTNSDYHQLIKLLSKPKNKRIIETHSRENPQKLLTKLLLQEPRLLSFLKHLF